MQDQPRPHPAPRTRHRAVRGWASERWRGLGPGLITGASDNDPSGITTYSVAGATTGYGLLWMAVFTMPLLVAVQSMSARIGAVKDEGLGQVIEVRQFRIAQSVEGGERGPALAGFGQAVSGAADREPLFVQQLANPADQQHFVVLVVASVATPFHRLELCEFLLPVTQHVRLDAAQFTHLTDGEVTFCGDGWERFLHENQ